MVRLGGGASEGRAIGSECGSLVLLQ
jgi:hypothetical protein